MSETLSERYLSAKRRLFDKYYATFLNPEQARAVFTARGPLLVLAGAGSGKTTVLVNRIAYLIKYGNAYHATRVPEDLSAETVEALEAVLATDPEEFAPILPDFISEPCPPWAILAFTFTNKAAREIRERLDRTFDDPTVSSAVWSGTFHSICVRILHRYGDRLGYKDGVFSIYDTDDKKRMLAQCMKELGIDEKRLSPRAVATAISMAKNELQTAEQFSITNDPRTGDIKRIYELYERRMRAQAAVDFDDIILRTVELLQQDEEVRRYYQQKFRYVLVDEYQDTNYAQFVLTKLLSDGYRNLMVVGDDDQSIYRFRGATVENILNFDKTYPDATVIKLEQNYRSTENILAAANAVIHYNDKRHDKRLWCDKGAGERIVLRENADQLEEGRYILDRIHAGVRGEGRHYRDYAVLYRVNELARSLETSFAKSGIPYRILGGQRFYDRKEIRDMLAYLSLVQTHGDDLRLRRVINEPKRKLGSATVEAVAQLAHMEGISMFAVMERAQEYPILAKSQDKLLAFVELILSVGRDCDRPSAMLDALFTRSGYRDMLVAEGFEGEGKIDHVNELIAGALEYEKRSEAEGEEATLAGFLEEISLVSDVDKYDEAADAVVLMTVHAAKGLEFPVVFLAGMEDGIFPSAQNLGIEEEMSEERRLCYVAITRAKERLYITYARNRTMYGRTASNCLSCFVRQEIPETLLERDVPPAAPPRAPLGYGAGIRRRTPPDLGELHRAPEIRSGAGRRRAEQFGVQPLPVGARVRHALFGEGEIVSARDLGGDVLYEVRFAIGVKKLMATFAKLERI